MGWTGGPERMSLFIGNFFLAAAADLLPNASFSALYYEDRREGRYAQRFLLCLLRFSFGVTIAIGGGEDGDFSL